MPVPLLPPVTVIHDVLLLTLVQPHPAPVVTVAVCEPPAATTVCDVGASVYAHAPVAACVIVTVCPAIVNVPVRVAPVVLASTVYVATPFAVPLPLVTAIQDALLKVVHVHPLGAVTEVDNGPPDAGAD